MNFASWVMTQTSPNYRCCRFYLFPVTTYLRQKNNNARSCHDRVYSKSLSNAGNRDAGGAYDLLGLGSILFLLLAALGISLMGGGGEGVERADKAGRGGEEAARADGSGAAAVATWEARLHRGMGKSRGPILESHQCSFYPGGIVPGRWWKRWKKYSMGRTWGHLPFRW